MYSNEFEHYDNASIIRDGCGSEYDYDEADGPLVNYGEGGTLRLDRDDESFHSTLNSTLSLAYESLRKRHALLEQQYQALLQENVNSFPNRDQNVAVSPKLLIATSKAVSPATVNGNGVGNNINSNNSAAAWTVDQCNQQLLEELDEVRRQNSELKMAYEIVRQDNEKLQCEVESLSRSTHLHERNVALSRAKDDDENDLMVNSKLKALLHMVRRLKHAAQCQNAALSAQCQSRGMLRKVNADPATVENFSDVSLTWGQLAQCSDGQEHEEQVATLAIGPSKPFTRLTEVTGPFAEVAKTFATAAGSPVGPSAAVARPPVGPPATIDRPSFGSSAAIARPLVEPFVSSVGPSVDVARLPIGPSAAVVKPSVGPSAAVSRSNTSAAMLPCSQQAAVTDTDRYSVVGSRRFDDTDADDVFTTFHKSNLGRGLALERDGAVRCGVLASNANMQLPHYRNRGSDGSIVSINNLSSPEEFNVGSAAAARLQSARLVRGSDVAEVDVVTSGYFSGHQPASASGEREQSSIRSIREKEVTAPRQDRVCPICMRLFANLHSQFDFEQHVNDCIDSKLAGQQDEEPVTMTNDNDVDGLRRDEKDLQGGNRGGRYENERGRYEARAYRSGGGRYETDEGGRYEAGMQNERGRYEASVYNNGEGRYDTGGAEHYETDQSLRRYEESDRGRYDSGTTMNNDPDDLECEDCGGLFFTLQQFLQHRQSHATKFSNMAEQKLLNLSNQVLPSSGNFQQHNERQCPVCDQVFEAKTLQSEIEAHTNSHFIFEDRIQEFD